MLKNNKLFLNLIIYLLFTIIYVKNKNNFNKKQLSNNDILYYSLVTHTTVGYGDIYPVTTQGKYITSLHILIVFIVNLFI